MSDLPVSQLTLHTTWGPITVFVRDARVSACKLPFQRAQPAAPLRVRCVERKVAQAADRPILNAAARYIRATLRGKSTPPPPLAWSARAPFTASCLHHIGLIPRGARITYAELARRAGRPRAARAAGRVCAMNPLPLFVPCHRVVAADGRLGGFSAGLGWKALLLRAEAQS